jgi:hypothetical protein
VLILADAKAKRFPLPSKRLTEACEVMEGSLLQLWNDAGTFARLIIVLLLALSVFTLAALLERWWQSYQDRVATRRDREGLTKESRAQGASSEPRAEPGNGAFKTPQAAMSEDEAKSEET